MSSDGKPVDPQIAVTPIFVQLEPTLLRIVGTGFFVSRYGLLLTAKHVVDEVAEHDAMSRPALTWLWKVDGTLRFRPIWRVSFFDAAPRDAADIAICQSVDRVKDGTAKMFEPNERIALVTRLPDVGAHIGTYAYPDNHQVDFSGYEKTGRVFADVFEGQYLALRGPSERFLRYPHLETSIDIRHGASGGPVFGSCGHAIAVNCRGWDFGTDSAAQLSSVVPISLVLELEFPCPYLPPDSWEEKAVPPERRTGQVTLRDLAAWGHISLDP
jgi:hypothetical protein